MCYLTNTKLENKERCEYAAKVSGMNVVFRDHPMPKHHSDPEERYYNPENLVGSYGSIFTYENGDHSKFWRAWESYKKE